MKLWGVETRYNVLETIVAFEKMEEAVKYANKENALRYGKPKYVVKEIEIVKEKK